MTIEEVVVSFFRKYGNLLCYAVIALGAMLVLSIIVSEVRWSQLNNPEGQFTNVREYLATGRPPSRVCKIHKESLTRFIAYGRLDDAWLALPSGPAAYVFDPSGKLVDWSYDVGDNPSFLERWPRESQQEIPIQEFQGPPPQR